METSPKTYQHRSVPFPASLLEPLRAQMAGKGPQERLFTAPDGGVLRNPNFRHRVFDPAVILTSNLPFRGWGGVLGDEAVAAAMIDRIVHHADVLTLKGASYRLRNRGIDIRGVSTGNAFD